MVDVFNNGRESLWDATLNKPVPQLIRILISDWAQKYFCAQSEASIYLTAFAIFLYEASFFRGSGPNKLLSLYLQREWDTFNS